MKYFSYEISKTLTRLRRDLAPKSYVSKKLRDYADLMYILGFYNFEELE